MALGDIKRFTFIENGLELEVVAIDMGTGTRFITKMISGHADVNAIYWNDGIADGNNFSAGPRVTMPAGQDWDNGHRFSNPAAPGADVSGKAGFLTAGETLVRNENVNWNDINTVGVFATNASNPGQSLAAPLAAAPAVPAPAISIGDVTVTEGVDAVAVFTVSLDQPYLYDVTVNFTKSAGTATSPSDYGGGGGTITILAGQTSATISIPITNDAKAELEENFTVNLVKATAAVGSGNIVLPVADAQGLGTIVNDDGIASFSVNDITVDEAAGTAVFTVTKTGGLQGSVNWALSDGTATRPADYNKGSVTGTLNFGANETTKTVSVNIINDNVAEVAEQFGINLSGASSGYTIVKPTGVATIDLSDQPIPSVSLSYAQQGDGETEGNVGVPHLFGFTFSNPIPENAIINFSVTPGTADVSDYQAQTFWNTFVLKGSTFGYFRVDTLDDAIYEGPTGKSHIGVPDLPETFTVSIVGAQTVSGVPLEITNASVEGRIFDNDPPPQFSIEDTTASENDADGGSVTFTVNKVGETAFDSSLFLHVDPINPGTASYDGPNADYDISQFPYIVTLAPDEYSKTVTIPWQWDRVFEDTETMRVVLVPANEHSDNLVKASATATITDDDNAQRVGSITQAVTVNEGVAAEITFMLDRPYDSDTLMAWETWETGDLGDTATKGVDFIGGGRHLFTVPAGETSYTFFVPTFNNDTGPENTEGFRVQVYDASAAAPTVSMPDAYADVTILENSRVVANDDINGGLEREWITGDLLGNDVHLDGNLLGVASITFGDVTLPFDPGSDYWAQHTITTDTAELIVARGGPYQYRYTGDLPGGETLSESFSYVLTDDRGNFDAGALSIEVHDNGPAPLPPVVTFHHTTVDENAGTGSVLVTLDRPATEDIVFEYFTRQVASATPGVDYVEIINSASVIRAGQSEVTIPFTINDDELVEGPEHFQVRSAGITSGNATMGDNTAQVDIIDDEVPVVTVSNPSAIEGEGLEFVFSLDEPAPSAFMITYHTHRNFLTFATGDVATEGEDYIKTDGELTFEAGQSSAVITVPTIGNDLVVENAELVELHVADTSSMVKFSNPFGDDIPQTYAYGTILNDFS